MIPLLAGPQLAPPSVLLRIPVVSPAYSVVGWTGSIASDSTDAGWNPLVGMNQLAPPSVLLYTKPLAAYNVEGLAGSIARAPTFTVAKPLLEALQLAPPLVLLKTPPLCVVMYSVVGLAG